MPAAPTHAMRSPADATDVERAATELAVTLRDRAAETERLRTMPADVVALVETAGLFDLLLPRALGGLEVDPATFLRVVERLSAADGAGGWTVLIGNSTAFFAWLDPDVARQLLGGRRAASTSVFAPLGRAVPAGDGAFVVDGRWPFNSGCVHAAWFQTGLLVTDADGAVQTLADGEPDYRFASFRADDGEIVDTWHAAGLCGTGSHDVVVTGLRVPAEQLATPGVDAPRHDGPLWRLPFLTLLGAMMAGFPLGVARRAIDELLALAATKRRGVAATTVADDPVVQAQVGRCEAELLAARAFAFDAIGAAWETALRGNVPSPEEQSHVQLAVATCMDSATRVVDAVFRMAGSSAVYADHPLQRCCRDIHVAAQHIAFSPETYRRHGHARLAPVG